MLVQMLLNYVWQLPHLHMYKHTLESKEKVIDERFSCSVYR